MRSIDLKSSSHINPKDSIKVSIITRRKFLGILGASLLGLGCYEYYSKNDIKVEKHHLRIPKWDANGVRIALIADTHISFIPQLQRAQRAIQLALQEKPDMLIFAGDLIESHNNPPQYQNLKTALQELHDADVPCFAVMGNHEYGLGNPKPFINLLKESPIKLLVNEVVDFQGISLIGINGPYHQNYKCDFIKSGNFSKSVLSIIHEPDICSLVKGVASLQLSGHSHGGQLCLPLGIPIIKHAGAELYYSGFYPNAPVPLYVSRGVGTTDIDLRLFCPPEVSILTVSSL